ncbi:MAG: complex I subunit 5 family protein [Campylobacterota bacterium]
MPHLLALLVALPLVFAISGFVFTKHARLIGLLGAFAWATVVVLTFSAWPNLPVYTFSDEAAALGIAYSVDAKALLMLGLSALIICIVTIYSFGKKDTNVYFYPLLCLLCTGLGVVFVSDDIFNLYVGLELISLTAVIMTALQGSREALRAALSYLFAALFGSGLYLLGVVLLYTNYGVLDLTLLQQRVTAEAPMQLAFVFFASGLGLKSALFVFGYWLPKAHGSAAPAVSALLSALVVKAGFFVLYLLYSKLFVTMNTTALILWLFGIGAIIYGGYMAFKAKKLKHVAAYSSLSQMGYLFLIFAFSSQNANAALWLQVSAHALAKAGLFLALGSAIVFTGRNAVSSIKGLSATLPMAAFAIALSAVTLIGLPPSLGFSAKWYYLHAALEQNNWLIIAAVLGGSVLAWAYMFKLLILTLQTPKSSPITKQPARLRLMQYCALGLSLLSVIGGIFTAKITAFLGVFHG